jgi:hypothetical protein
VPDDDQRAGSPTPVSAPLALDLRLEGQRLVRRRLVPTGLGVGFGIVFIGVGGYEINQLATAPLSPNLLVAALVLVLGVALIVLSVRAGLLNPVLVIQGDSAGLRLLRRYGGVLLFPWSEPGYAMEVEDLSPDPSSTPEEKRHLFFTASGATYGSLTAGALGLLLDCVRSHGLTVKMSDDRFRTGRESHQIRRIRIGWPKGK